MRTLKHTRQYLALICACFCFMAMVVSLDPAVAAAADDLVFQAMTDEMARTSQKLVMPGMEPPHFVSYCIEDEASAVIRAGNGALVQTLQNNNRRFYIDIRVGDLEQDNSYYIGNWQDVFIRPMAVVEEDDYAAIRHQLWLYSDAAYKRALENLARKKSYLASHPVKEQIPDLSASESSVFEQDPVDLELDIPFWEQQIQLASRTLQDFPGLQDWQVTLQSEAENKRYLNTDGSRFLKSCSRTLLEVSATAQAADGQRLTNFRRELFVDGDEPLSGDQLVAEVRLMAQELLDMAGATSLDEYAGPVLYTDYATAQIVSQLFASQLSPARPPIIQEDWMRQYLPEAKLVRRINRRVMPDFIDIKDDPTRREFDGVRLAGFQKVDDEGITATTLDLVREGRLVDLPTSRRPSKKIRTSNGHARLLDNQWVVPAVSNLFLEAGKTRSEKKLLKQLRDTAKEFGNEFGLLVKRFDRPEISAQYSWSQSDGETNELTTAPIIMYKVYVDDGRLEPVRGLLPDEITVRTLRDIIAVGEDKKAYNYLQTFSMQTDAYPTAIVTPSILIEEVGFREISSREPLPVSASPLAVAR